MSGNVDYNAKFKQLGKKITSIAKETKMKISLCNSYNQRISDIEQKAGRRLNALDKSFLSLKEDFLKLTNKYEVNTQISKNNSISTQSNELTQKVQTQLKSQRENLVDYINQIFETIEKEITATKTEKKLWLKKCSQKVLDYQSELNDLTTGINKKLNQPEDHSKVLSDIKEETQSEFGIINEKIKAETQGAEKNQEELKKNCDELVNKIEDEFKKQKKQREEFEENIFDLIEETCAKLAEENK